MRIHRLILLGVALGIQHSGGAQLPFPTQAFAEFEGALDFCAKADPEEPEKYQKLKLVLVKRVSEKDASDARNTQEYQDAYEQATSEYARMPKVEAAKACAASLEIGKAGLIPQGSTNALATKLSITGAPFRNQPPRISNREAAVLQSVWGIEAPSVKAVESGVIIRFTYSVVDPEKAAVLIDKKFEPVLQCPDKRVQLVIPSLEKVGQLRQAPHNVEAGKSYWMAFSNSGRPVRPGDRVDIVIGNFRVRGLIVE